MPVNMNTDVETLIPLQATPSVDTSPTAVHMMESNVSGFGTHSELLETTSR